MAEWSAIPDRSASLHDQYEAAKVHVEMAFDDLLKALEEAKANKVGIGLSQFDPWMGLIAVVLARAVRGDTPKTRGGNRRSLQKDEPERGKSKRCAQVRY